MKNKIPQTKYELETNSSIRKSNVYTMCILVLSIFYNPVEKMYMNTKGLVYARF